MIMKKFISALFIMVMVLTVVTTTPVFAAHEKWHCISESVNQDIQIYKSDCGKKKMAINYTPRILLKKGNKVYLDIPDIYTVDLPKCKMDFQVKLASNKKMRNAVTKTVKAPELQKQRYKYLKHRLRCKVYGKTIYSKWSKVEKL